MTKAQLIEALKDVPDDTLVVIDLVMAWQDHTEGDTIPVLAVMYDPGDDDVWLCDWEYVDTTNTTNMN